MECVYIYAVHTQTATEQSRAAGQRCALVFLTTLPLALFVTPNICKLMEVAAIPRLPPQKVLMLALLLLIAAPLVRRALCGEYREDRARTP